MYGLRAWSELLWVWLGASSGFVFYFELFAVAVFTAGNEINNKLEEDLEGSGRGLHDVLRQHFPTLKFKTFRSPAKCQKGISWIQLYIFTFTPQWSVADTWAHGNICLGLTKTLVITVELAYNITKETKYFVSL
jgi:hypothetical protein